MGCGISSLTGRVKGAVSPSHTPVVDLSYPGRAARAGQQKVNGDISKLGSIPIGPMRACDDVRTYLPTEEEVE